MRSVLFLSATLLLSSTALCAASANAVFQGEVLSVPSVLPSPLSIKARRSPAAQPLSFALSLTALPEVTCAQAAQAVAEAFMSEQADAAYALCMDADNPDYDECVSEALEDAIADLKWKLQQSSVVDAGCSKTPCEILIPAVEAMLDEIDECQRIWLPGMPLHYWECFRNAQEDMLASLDGPSLGGPCDMLGNLTDYYDSVVGPAFEDDIANCLLEWCTSY